MKQKNSAWKCSLYYSLIVSAKLCYILDRQCYFITRLSTFQWFFMPVHRGEGHSFDCTGFKNQMIKSILRRNPSRILRFDIIEPYSNFYIYFIQNYGKNTTRKTKNKVPLKARYLNHNMHPLWIKIAQKTLNINEITKETPWTIQTNVFFACVWFSHFRKNPQFRG